MEQKTKNRLLIFLSWTLTLVVLGTFTLYGYYGERINPFETKLRKLELLSAMRIQLHEAVEAEKNAVFAISDKESENFAAEARQATDVLENSRKEIEAIIRGEKRPRETDMLNEFNSCWTQYKKLDEAILALASQNTNLKAQKLSASQCAREMEHFEKSLNRLIQRNTDSKQCNKAVPLSYKALTAGLKILTLHKPHIEEVDDEKMDKIEQSINSYDEEARKSLSSLRSIADPSDNEDLSNAVTAYDRFMNLTGEVLKLSRMNTNIKSAELSLGKKRLISSQCGVVLANLQKAVQAQPFRATR